MSVAENTTDDTRPSGLKDEVRKNLVQVFFGLVLTQIAVYITSLVDIWAPASLDYWAAWGHIILAFALTTTSWFGWQMSVRKARLNEEASVFQGGFILSILDILLVTLYFLLVHQVEMEGVAAFPPSSNPKLTAPNAKPETWIILIVFVIYVAWDTVSLVFKEKEYGPWPSLVCGGLALLSLVPTYAETRNQAASVLLIDAYLFGVVFLFRALKRLQKWNWHNRPNETSFQFRGAPGDIRSWVIVCCVWSGIMYLVSIAPVAGAWVCG